MDQKLHFRCTPSPQTKIICLFRCKTVPEESPDGTFRVHHRSRPVIRTPAAPACTTNPAPACTTNRSPGIHGQPSPGMHNQPSPGIHGQPSPEMHDKPCPTLTDPQRSKISPDAKIPENLHCFRGSYLKLYLYRAPTGCITSFRPFRPFQALRQEPQEFLPLRQLRLLLWSGA